MSYSIRSRSSCRICKSAQLKIILEFPDMPFTDDFVSQEQKGTEFTAPIRIFWCESCNTVQTLHDVDVTDYYEDYQYSVGASTTASAFMDAISTSVIKKYFNSAKSTRVLEVGSGDGAQLAAFQKLGCEVLGYEPSKLLCDAAESRGVSSIKGLFDEHSISKLPPSFRQADIVMLSYTFDHLPDPRGFLHTLRSVVNQQKGILIIEIHDLEKIINRKEYCLFEHEHSIYLTRLTALALMEQEGYVVIDFDIVPEAIRRANSLIVVATPKDSMWSSHKIKEIRMDGFSGYPFYAKQAKEIQEGIQNLEKFIDRMTSMGKRIAGYGAGGRGVMTLAAITNAQRLTYLVDKKPKRPGIFTPKTHVPVVGIDHLRENPVEAILVFSFGYMQEIQKELAAFGYRPVQFYSLLDVLSGSLNAEV